MSKLYDVTVRTDAKGVSTVLAVLDGSVDLRSVNQVDEGGETSFKIRHRKPKGGMTGAQLLEEFAKKNPGGFRAFDAAKHFEENGFAGTSAGSRISAAVRDGVIDSVGSGYYKIARLK